MGLDIVADVCAVLGIGTAGLERPGRLNTNLSAPALRFLEALNRALSGRTEAEAAWVRGWVLPRLPPGGGVLPPRDEVSAFMAQFATGNEAVRAAWFAERLVLFEDDLARYPEAPEPVAAGEPLEVMIGMILAKV